jgi:hypothetical protein
MFRDITDEVAKNVRIEPLIRPQYHYEPLPGLKGKELAKAKKLCAAANKNERAWAKKRAGK